MFRENQKFSKNWLAWIVLLPIFIICFAIYQQVILDNPFGNNPLPVWFLVTILILLLLLSYLILNLRLVTIISKDSIDIAFYPLLKKSFKIANTRNLKVIDYGFVGGWGVRLFTKHGTVYNVKGNKGLSIVLKNGKKYVVGTQKDEELTNLIKSIKR